MIKQQHSGGDLGRKGEEVRLMREKLDQTDTVRGMREAYDKWMEMVDGKLMFLNKQVKEGVGSMSNPETASLQDIFKAMATKVRGSFHFKELFFHIACTLVPSSIPGEPALGRGGGRSGEKRSGKNPESLSGRPLCQSEGEQAQGELC